MNIMDSHGNHNPESLKEGKVMESSENLKKKMDNCKPWSSKHMLKRGIQTTSMKGVPRIVNSDIVCLKIFWIVFVLILLCLSFYSIVSLSIQYYEYPTATEITTKYVNSANLPSITVCDLTWDLKIQSYNKDIVSYSEYLHKLDDSMSSLITNDTRAVLTTNDSSIHWNYMRNFGYSETTGTEGVAKLAKPVDAFILDCTMQTSVRGQDKPCTTYFNIEKKYSSLEFPNCLTISANTDETLNILGLSLILNIGSNYSSTIDSTDLLNTITNSNTFRSQKGAKVALHKKQELLPDLYFGGDLVSPGFNYLIDISHDQYIRLSEPYGQCGFNSAFMNVTHGVDIQEYYNEGWCVISCTMTKMVSECDCIGREALFTSLNPEKRFCGYLYEDNIAETISKVDCYERNKNTILQSCQQQCPTACSEFIYKGEYSFTKWPNEDLYKLAIYNEIIKGSMIESQFSHVYEEIKQHISDNNTSHALTLLRNEESIGRHFVKLDFMFEGTNHITVWKNSRQIPLTAMFSQLGGVLNLFSGISMIIFGEILEVIVRLIYNTYKRYNQG